MEEGLNIYSVVLDLDTRASSGVWRVVGLQGNRRWRGCSRFGCLFNFGNYFITLVKMQGNSQR